MLAAATLGLPILSAGTGTGTVWLDPLKQIELDFIKQFSRAGIIIMVLFGFSAYMSHIGANDVAVKIMSKPIAKIRSPYILVPIVFWIGSLLSLIIPSAASLAVILMATLYPILRVANMSSLSAAGVIATTATIVPTPLGGDNVVFYSFIELIPSIATQAHVDPVMIALPMQLTSNLIRAMSPVSAVVIIVASVVKVSPIEVVKRTSVPLLIGFIATLIFTLIRYSL
ncbi:hypothetical protein FOT80_11840 [Serratia fonticola]|nr:hypothetical protein [Serratia fonticola]